MLDKINQRNKQATQLEKFDMRSYKSSDKDEIPLIEITGLLITSEIQAPTVNRNSALNSKAQQIEFNQS